MSTYRKVVCQKNKKKQKLNVQSIISFYLFLTVQGTVKVHARLLSAAAEAKTYVITTRTTARDLIAMVIASYRTICEDNSIFNLVLETGNSRRAGKNINVVLCMTKRRELCTKLFKAHLQL